MYGGELTLITDFAEVDLDSQVVNLNRFPLFFPERRPFFLSGLDVFQFGTLKEAQLFFTRRIGLDDDANSVPILGGLNLYGREGSFSFGFLSSPSTRNPVVFARMRARNDFFGGAAYSGQVNFAAAFGQHVRTSIDAIGSLLVFRGREVVPTLVFNGTLSVTPSPWVVIDLVSQVNTVRTRFIGMARLRWRYLSGSDLFLVHRAQVDYGEEDVSPDQRVTLKLSYRYDAVF